MALKSRTKSRPKNPGPIFLHIPIPKCEKPTLGYKFWMSLIMIGICIYALYVSYLASGAFGTTLNLLGQSSQNEAQKIDERISQDINDPALYRMDLIEQRLSGIQLIMIIALVGSIFIICVGIPALLIFLQIWYLVKK
jgi:hypothetical protein